MQVRRAEMQAVEEATTGTESQKHRNNFINKGNNWIDISVKIIYYNSNSY